MRTLVAILIIAALAGCSDTPTDGPVSTPTDDPVTGTGPAPLALGAAPTWQVGQSWRHEYTISGNTSFTVNSIVVEAGDGYGVATDDETNAINAAAFFFHDLGRMDASWSMHQQDLVYPWYQFPLTDGKTWTAREENLDFNLQPVSRELTMTARLVNATGTVPAHFAIEQRTADGGLRATYDYRPDLGWFSEARLYDPGSPGSEPQVIVQTTGAQKGWTGTYYQADAEMSLNYFSYASPVGGQASLDPGSTFPVDATATHVMAILFAFSAGGAAHAQLVAPDGQHWESDHASDPNGVRIAGDNGIQIVVPAVAGDWLATVVGAGVFAFGGGVFGWQMTVTQASL